MNADRLTLIGLVSVPTTLLLAFLTPVQAVAYDRDDARPWLRDLNQVHALADSIWGELGGSLDRYDFWGRWTVIGYLGALAALWAFHRVSAPAIDGWRLLLVCLMVAGVADVAAYSGVPGLSHVGGSIEFFALPLLLAGTVRYGWVLARTGLPSWPGWVLLGSAAAVVPSMALTAYWPHGALVPISTGLSALAVAAFGSTEVAHRSTRSMLS